ncbi:hypothetical protein T4D_310 [Trichinella pseudospiralis]|uniref:Uncharacterized protein n=1 Tax=Trichinella pseudospiralis TaxID=6337 RepID=A0A0V1F778_TRIPS|nr:hypothetical protein T4D_310 [Trichinella pseudospiralis]
MQKLFPHSIFPKCETISSCIKGEICSEINYPDVAIPTGKQALVVWLISILQLANTRCQYQWLFQFYLCFVVGFLSKTKGATILQAFACLSVCLPACYAFTIVMLERSSSSSSSSKTTMENPNRSSPLYDAVQFY